MATPSTSPTHRPFLERVGEPLRRSGVHTLQVNLGKLCNQACSHCHVDAGPRRTEVMTAETVDRLLALLPGSSLTTLDLTGGAPELNPNFRRLVVAARLLGLQVIDRCNLTVLCEAGQEDLVEFLAAHQVRLVCSLPCYLEENVDTQRGRGVFETSIQALQRLNALGYGQTGGDLILDLVYNPVGAKLPPSQAELEQDYKAELEERFGLRFNQLLTITNMPIARFDATLRATGQRESYLALLEAAFNAATVPGLMCRHLVSIDWKGRVYDCDFNQMLGMLAPAAAGRPIWQCDLKAFGGQTVAVADHCYGCTAGAGSSCGGALAD